ncbi:NUDIX domain-containing protein [Halorussus amylolyticus]|uniref:NUDIX domain-containing protein n=1 Tax=Halorussus amylolyticus TaxID=1126242 RepID=UPI00105034AD|nr:NUDIX domain-containing protein [Halorussus amylolyticus]
MTTRSADFCPYCGTELAHRKIDGRDRQYCESCERVVWRNPVPTAGVAVVSDAGVLLTRRAIEPGVGDWAVPGGHLELDESPAAAAVRELREETGVRVAPEDVTLLDTFAADGAGGKRIVSVGFAVRREDTTGDPEPRSEVSEVRWFTPESFAETDAAFLPPHRERFERAWKWFGRE